MNDRPTRATTPRHASFLRTLTDQTSFPEASDAARTRAEVLELAGPFIVADSDDGGTDTPTGNDTDTSTDTPTGNGTDTSTGNGTDT